VPGGLRLARSSNAQACGLLPLPRTPLTIACLRERASREGKPTLTLRTSTRRLAGRCRDCSFRHCKAVVRRARARTTATRPNRSRARSRASARCMRSLLARSSRQGRRANRQCERQGACIYVDPCGHIRMHREATDHIHRAQRKGRTQRKGCTRRKARMLARHEMMEVA
jgi:hypothetical protein